MNDVLSKWQLLDLSVVSNELLELSRSGSATFGHASANFSVFLTV